MENLADLFVGVVVFVVCCMVVFIILAALIDYLKYHKYDVIAIRILEKELERLEE